MTPTFAASAGATSISLAAASASPSHVCEEKKLSSEVTAAAQHGGHRTPHERRLLVAP